MNGQCLVGWFAIQDSLKRNTVLCLITNYAMLSFVKVLKKQNNTKLRSHGSAHSPQSFGKKIIIMSVYHPNITTIIDYIHIIHLF